MELRFDRWSASVVEVGGGLRELRRNGAPVLDGYGAGDMARGGRGQVLAPWPNRLAGGRYLFGGREIEVPVNERATGSAIHGLARWSPWRIAQQTPSRCVVELRLHPQPAYPFTADLTIEYALDDGGLEVRLGATNAGEVELPFGAGFHPYLTLGGATIDRLRAQVPAASWLPADARGIPTGERRPVADDLDLREGPRIGARVLDHCLTDLRRDADGIARVTLTDPEADGEGVALWMDAAWPFVMVFTGDTVEPARRRHGLAVEPMTCAPDAFNSGDGLLVLRPGESFSGRWGIGDPALVS